MELFQNKVLEKGNTFHQPDVPKFFKDGWQRLLKSKALKPGWKKAIQFFCRVIWQFCMVTDTAIPFIKF